MEVLQKVARGTSRVDELVKPKDLARGRSDVGMRFEIEWEFQDKICEYVIAFELPPGSKELRVLEERLGFFGEPIYTRQRTEVQHFSGAGPGKEASFQVDSELAAMPIIVPATPNFLFRGWLARTLILRPVPVLIKGDSQSETLMPKPHVTDLGAWFSGILSQAPAAYPKIDSYLRAVMPDFEAMTNPRTGRDSRSLTVQFSNEQGSLASHLKTYRTARNAS